MDDLRQTVSRIDENVRLLRQDVEPLARELQKNSQDIALLKNNERWKSKISHGFFGLLGVILGALAEFYRK